MAGTINLAFTQQFDMDGAPLSGGLLYFFTAGTTTPQSAFQDTGLTIVHPNPIVLDASGRVPMFYLADGFIKIRLTDKNGVTVIAADQLLVIGPSTSTGGGGGGTTPGDVTQFLSTGDIKARYSTIVIDGYVRLNGLSIGNTGSSATERADPACQPLFVYLWAFPNITLDGFVKGANALADFTAGRRMFLPDLRGRTIAGLDDMGNPTAASRLTSTFFGTSGIVLGNVGGDEKHSLVLANLPTHTPTGSVTGVSANGSSSGGFSGSISGTADGQVPAIATLAITVAIGGTSVFSPVGSSGFSSAGISGVASGVSGSCSGSYSGSASVSGGTGVFTGTAINPGGATNHATMAPAMVLTFYMKM